MYNFGTSAITTICIHELRGSTTVSLGRCPSRWKCPPRYGALDDGLLWPKSTVKGAEFRQPTSHTWTVQILAPLSFKLGTQSVCAQIRAEEIRVNVPLGRVIYFQDEFIFGQCCSKKKAIV
jgi:hypothetical protein